MTSEELSERLRTADKNFLETFTEIITERTIGPYTSKYMIGTDSNGGFLKGSVISVNSNRHRPILQDSKKSSYKISISDDFYNLYKNVPF